WRRSVLARAVTKSTPSKPRSDRPFWTAIARPPITDTMTTSEVVPSTMPTSVSIDRSLWAVISPIEVRIDSRTFTLLVPQGFDRVQPGRLHRGVEAEHDPHHDREGEAGEHDPRRPLHRLVGEASYQPGE